MCFLRDAPYFTFTGRISLLNGQICEGIKDIKGEAFLEHRGKTVRQKEMEEEEKLK